MDTPAILSSFQALLKELVANRLPDLHLGSGRVPLIRRHSGELEPIEAFGVLQSSDVDTAVRFMLGYDDVRFAAWKEHLESDFSFAYEGHRFRVNAYHDALGSAAALRFIPTDIPSCADLSIPANIVEMLGKSKGLLLVTGPTGSGKSTTLAAMIRHINETSRRHIITIEDPIEFHFLGQQALINQREVGTHTRSFAGALRSCLREDPDVIMVGEMRDPETIAAALTLAETGHLVLSTLHTNDTVQSIDRIIDVFPAAQQLQVRTQLAMSLTAVVSQMLLPRLGTQSRIAAREILVNTDAVRSVILQGLPQQLYSVIELSAADGMRLMDQSLMDLYTRKSISLDTLKSRIRDKDLIASYS